MNPFHWKKKITKYNEHRGREDTLTEKDREMGELAKQSYSAVKDRKSFGNYKYNEEKSGDNFAVYHNPEDNKNYLVFKGTSDYNDAMPDLSILFGYQGTDQSFQDAQAMYEFLKNENKDHDWEVVGHSLGGAKAMYVAERNGIKSHAFNPGYNNYLDDELDPSYKGHNLYVRKGDPISNTILTEELGNAKVLASKGWSARKNHSIDSFGLEDTVEDDYDWYDG
jgi:hypothetical protein